MRVPAIALAVLVGATAANAQFATRTTNPHTSNGGGYLGTCGTEDDSTTENALGLTAGGELAWMHHLTCLGSVGSAESAYGTAMFPGSVTNGANSRSAVYSDSDGDGQANTGLTKLAEVSTTITNGDTDILNPFPYTGSYAISNDGWILASADHVAGQFPAPMDQDNAPNSWWCGNTGGNGSLDLDNLNGGGNIPPSSMSSIGFPTAFLLRASGDSGGPGTETCPGDGVSNTCPCGNNDTSGLNGCLNGTGAGGHLTGNGSNSIGANNLVLTASNLEPGQPGLFFQGDNDLNGGGNTLGDGIRCCGGNVIRIQQVPADGNGNASSTDSISGDGGVSPGDNKCYQYWYRNPGGSPCGFGFNTTNSYLVTWSA